MIRILTTLIISILGMAALNATTVIVKGNISSVLGGPMPNEYVMIYDSISGITDTVVTDSLGNFCTTLSPVTGGTVQVFRNCQGGNGVTQLSYVCGDTLVFSLTCQASGGGGSVGSNYCSYVYDSLGNPVMNQYISLINNSGNAIAGGLTDSSGMYCDTASGIIGGRIINCNWDTITSYGAGAVTFINCPQVQGTWCNGWIIVNGATGPTQLTITNITTGASYTAMTDSSGYYTDTILQNSNYTVSATTCTGGTTSSQWNCNQWPTASLNYCGGQNASYCVTVEDSLGNPVVGDTVLIINSLGTYVSVGVTNSFGVYCDSLPVDTGYTSEVFVCTGASIIFTPFLGGFGHTVNTGCGGTPISYTYYCVLVLDSTSGVGVPVVNDSVTITNNLGVNMIYFTDSNGMVCDSLPTGTYVASIVNCTGSVVTRTMTPGVPSTSLIKCQTPVSWGNLICGTIYDDTMPIAAMVYLVQFDTSGGGSLISIDSTLANFGTYCFQNVPVGQYFVKAFLQPGHPQFSNYLPTYYGDELYWYLSNTVFSPNPGLQYDINLVNGVNPGGPGFVGGLVIQGANKMAAPGDALANVQVNLTNTATGDAVGYLFTDANGEYNFTNLAFGTYEICIDIIGHQSNCHTVTLDQSYNGENNYDFKIHSNYIEPQRSATSIELPQLEGLKMYPNPVADVLNIDFGTELVENVTYNVVNISGAIIATNNVQLTNNQLQIPTNNLANGLYNFSFTVNGTNYNYRFVKL